MSSAVILEEVSDWITSQLQIWDKWTTNSVNKLTTSKRSHTKENMPPTKWKLGHIIAIHPGNDGRVRVVTVRSANQTEIPRLVIKLCRLPVYGKEDCWKLNFQRGENVCTSVTAVLPILSVINIPPHTHTLTHEKYTVYFFMLIVFCELLYNICINPYADNKVHYRIPPYRLRNYYVITGGSSQFTYRCQWNHHRFFLVCRSPSKYYNIVGANCYILYVIVSRKSPVFVVIILYLCKAQIAKKLYYYERESVHTVLLLQGAYRQCLYYFVIRYGAIA